MRCAHVSLHGGEEPHRAGRARGDHLQDQRGSAFLLPPARHIRRGRHIHHRQRILQGSIQGTADGIRRRGAEIAQRQFGRRRRLIG